MSLPQVLRDQLTLPAVSAPMFLVSNVELAAESCKAGIIGSLTRNHCRDLEELGEQLAAVAEQIARFRNQNPGSKVGPLAVNIATHVKGDDMRAHVALCKRHGASIIITSVGDPSESVPLIREAGLFHYHDVTSLRF